MAARLQAFTGEIPRADKRLLPQNGAQNASNVILTSGRIEPVFAPAQVATLSLTSAKTIYRMYDASGEYWLAWDEDVDVIRSPLTGDERFRIYYTGETFPPKVTNLQFATSGTPYPKTEYILGVVSPITAPTVAPAAGGTQETRVYVYTFVNAFFDESAPSPPSTAVAGGVTGTWNLSTLDLPPVNSYTISAAVWNGGQVALTFNTTFGLRAGERIVVTGLLPASLNIEHKITSIVGNVVSVPVAVDPTITDGTGAATRDADHYTLGMTRRIYRSSTTAAGETDFFFVAEIATSATTFADSVLAKDLGEPLITDGWEMPPTDLRGICLHSSGAAVGFTDNVLHFSEAGAPYAWPTDYQHTTESPIVGIAIIGQSVVVCTQGRPYICSGSDPSAMSMVRREQIWPCLSKRGIVTTNVGVLFPTPLGLAVIGSVEDIYTKSLYSQVEWARVKPQLFTAAQYDDRYFAATTIDEPGQPVESLVLVVSGEWGVSRVHLNPSALYTDKANGKLYAAYDGKVWEWNANLSARLVASWISKEWVVPDPLSLGAAKIDCDFVFSKAEIDAINAANAAIITANQAKLTANATKGQLNAHMLNEFQLNGDTLTPATGVGLQPVSFTLYVDGQVFYNTAVYDNNAFRLPGRKKYDAFAVGIVSQVPIRQVVIGESPAALKSA